MEEVPQINSTTGVSMDYFNNWVPLAWRFKARGKQGVADLVRDHPVQRYTEAFPLTAFRL